MAGDAKADGYLAGGRRPRVAIVDGNASDVLVTAELVGQFGCVPLRAATGEAALALLRRDEPVDLVLINLSLPDMDGVVAALLIRTLGERGAMPIIPLVPDRNALTARRCRAAGFRGAIVKPYSPDELHAAIMAALHPTSAATLLRDA